MNKYLTLFSVTVQSFYSTALVSSAHDPGSLITYISYVNDCFSYSAGESLR